MRKKPRVVVDTNVIVSGLLVPGSAPAKIIDAWIAGRGFQPVLSKALIAEVNEVLRRPKIKARLTRKLSPLKVVLGILVNKAVQITPKHLDDGLFSDSKDHFLLELAVTAKARAIELQIALVVFTSPRLLKTPIQDNRAEPASQNARAVRRALSPADVPA